MTQIPELLGLGYDAPAKLPDGIDLYQPKRQRALARLLAAEADGAAEIIRILRWELGLLDLTIAPADGVSAYRGGDFSAYAEYYGLAEATADYARERAGETNDIILKLHYLEYVLLRREPRGREWIQLQREVLGCYRDYADGCRTSAAADSEGFAGLHIERALVAVGRLFTRPGLLRGDEPSDWAAWLVRLAEDSRAFPARSTQEAKQQRHRWVASYLAHLADLPADAASNGLRTQAFALLDDATSFYQATPLNDHFERHVADVDAALRKHWGETGTHERRIRRHFDAAVRRAEFHETTGNGLLTAHFYREARRIVEEYRQFFAPTDVARLARAEQSALEHAVEAGEFAEIRVPMFIPDDMIDFTRDSPEATVQALLEHVIECVPNRAEIESHVDQVSADAPLQALIGRTVIAPGKVVGESYGEEGNRALDVEREVGLQAHMLGVAVATTVAKATASVGLTAEHLARPLTPLSLDEGSMHILRHAFERFVQGDFVSTLYIIVPNVEDVLRQHLKAIGVDTTDFRRDVGDGTSRTDDATLGSLMRKSHPDGRSVRDYLGTDLWEFLDSVLNSQTGLNLRNQLAHGLARPQHCSRENAGLSISLLYLLADVARRNSGELRPDVPVSGDPSAKA